MRLQVRKTRALVEQVAPQQLLPVQLEVAVVMVVAVVVPHPQLVLVTLVQAVVAYRVEQVVEQVVHVLSRHVLLDRVVLAVKFQAHQVVVEQQAQQLDNLGVPEAVALVVAVTAAVVVPTRM